MGRGHQFLERMAEEADMDDNSLAHRPIVEIAGDCRVLIENHYGIQGYSRERILVKVKYGCICICGGCLEILRMTREQLVIRGRIDGVTLQRREKT